MYKTWNSNALIWTPADLDKKKGKVKKGSWKNLYLELKKQFKLSQKQVNMIINVSI